MKQTPKHIFCPNYLIFLFLTMFSAQTILHAQTSEKDSVVFKKIADEILLNGTCYEDLRTLCKSIGHRLSGSDASLRAIQWAQQKLIDAGADTVWLQRVVVPHWTRGKESLSVKSDEQNDWITIPMLSLGNSVGTEGKTIETPVVMVTSFEELEHLSPERIRGKILFLNHKFPMEFVNTFEGYAHAGIYRWACANVASAKGAVAVVIRSISTGVDDIPHTGSMSYADSIKPIPAVAIGNQSSDRLEKWLQEGAVSMRLTSHCKMLDPTMSFNVIGEIKGTEHPEEILVAGAHLDSWDVGEGAHDDGAGCVQVMEVIRTFRSLQLQPKRTIRAVLFINEENGLKGGITYADSAFSAGETHIFALESDAGGFSPRGFSLGMSKNQKESILSFKSLFLPYGVYDFSKDGGGADISPLKKQGVPVAGLLPDSQPYFDVHHSPADVFETVNHRELKMGAVVMTQLIYLVSQYGIPQ